MKKIYISYANQDLQLAKSVETELKNNNLIAYFIDHTEENIHGDVANDMLSGIKNCDVFLCLYSKNSNQSNFVSIELNAAVKRDKQVYIINVDKTYIEKKTNFAIANSILLKGDFKTALKEFISTIKGAI